jgi:soluble lytic murein transglycosylase-like protein
MQARWDRDSLPGYRTLGTVRLDSKKVARWITIASRETNVPELMLDTIIRYSSGYRPGVISEDGRYGLMQLDPHHLRSVGIEFGDLLDPRENILVGARYLARLTHRFSDLILGLAAFRLGAQAIEDAGRQLPEHRDTVWFVREMITIFYASKLDVPQDIAVESMAFVWNWIE